MALGDSDSEGHRAQAAAAADDGDSDSDDDPDSESDQEGDAEPDDEAPAAAAAAGGGGAAPPSLDSVTMTNKAGSYPVEWNKVKNIRRRGGALQARHAPAPRRQGPGGGGLLLPLP